MRRPQRYDRHDPVYTVTLVFGDNIFRLYRVSLRRGCVEYQCTPQIPTYSSWWWTENYLSRYILFLKTSQDMAQCKAYNKHTMYYEEVARWLRDQSPTLVVAVTVSSGIRSDRIPHTKNKGNKESINLLWKDH